MSDIRGDWPLLIDAEAVHKGEDEREAVINPADGTEVATFVAGTEEDINRAVDSAKAAFKTWSTVSPEERGNRLYAIADRIDDHFDELAEIATLENGKPKNQSGNDVFTAVETFRYYAGATDKFYGDVVENSIDEMKLKVFEPQGVVGVVIPWNWPPMHTADFISVALATGNTVVLKPAPQTPMSSIRMVELMLEELPPGTVNVVTGGVEPGAALTAHDDVDMVAFTGHDETGETVMQSAAENITSVMLELGGKNAAIVFEDADIEKAVSGALLNAFYNSGQSCASIERLLLHEEIYDEFLSMFLPEVEQLTVGDGLNPDSQVGPIIDAAQYDKIRTALQKAIDDGATIAAQASIPSEPELDDGHWVGPTVLTDVDPSMSIMNEEVFGPVLAVDSFTEDEEAIRVANDVEYGLTAGVWTESLERAHRVASRMESGMVGVNRPSFVSLGLPFGGYKRSGVGRKRDVTETMREYVKVKSIQIDHTDARYSLDLNLDDQRTY